MFFLLFYFIRNFALWRTIELSGSNFRIKYWSLYVELRFSRDECPWSVKICSFNSFRIWSAIAQQITRDLCKYCTSFGVFIRLELDVQLHFHFLPVWGKWTKFSSVPTKIMAMDVPTYACIKFKQAVWSWLAVSPSNADLVKNCGPMGLLWPHQPREGRSFFCVLPVYFNWANAILAVKLHCPNICWNIYFGEWTCLDCFARQLQFTVAWYI